MRESNSSEYWDERFRGDWDEAGGPDQTAFFGRLSVALLPPALVQYAISRRWSVCDWGCAEGDATDLLAALLEGCDVVGIDFAPSAIATAQRRYPERSFRAVDLLQSSVEEPAFDLIFSSNTLEHFTDPWHVLDQLACYTRFAMILLVPFEEADLIAEHAYRFERGSIRASVGEFRLGMAAVVDTSNLPFTRWIGRQILLVYTADTVPWQVLLDERQTAARPPLDRVGFEQEYQRLYDLHFAATQLLTASHRELDIAKSEQAMTAASLAATQAELGDATETADRLRQQLDRSERILRGVKARLEATNREQP